MKKLTIGYDPFNKDYLIANSPSGYFDRNIARFREGPNLPKLIEEYLASQDANKRIIGLISEERSRGLAETSQLIDIIKSINKKAVKLK